jgi:hypothetical protein
VVPVLPKVMVMAMAMALNLRRDGLRSLDHPMAE